MNISLKKDTDLRSDAETVSETYFISVEFTARQITAQLTYPVNLR